MSIERAARWFVLVVMIVMTIRFARAPLDQRAMDTFLHMPDLVFHEAGHVIFRPFGEFMTVLGGSLFQFLVPLICAASFAYQYQNWFAAAVMTWWAGQNLIDLAPYIADARKLQLILLGGRTGAEVEGHDWEYLLTELRWLHLDMTLGRAAHTAGTLIMVGSVVWAGWILLRRRDELT